MNFMKLLRATLVLCALSAGLISNAKAGFHLERSNTTGADTMDMSAIYIGAGTEVPYHAFTFEVDRVGQYTFLAMADYDSTLLLYWGDFNPLAPVTNIYTQNNDAGVDKPDMSGFAAFLVPTVKYTLVVSGLLDNAFGNYNVTFAGPGEFNLSPVPEPSTWLMLGLGLAGIGLAGRRRAARL